MVDGCYPDSAPMDVVLTDPKGVGGKVNLNMDPMHLGHLRNGNRRGNPADAPRCGARTRSDTSCQAPAMANGRCRMHGGASTGPRTAEGLARMRKARTRTGLHTKEMRELRAELAEMRRWAKEAWEQT
jgi:hypothetical protein